MNYDTSISDSVNLSRVFDEMLIDGSDLGNVVQFLKQHESDISDIYHNSAFAYRLYDVMSNPYGIDPFLIEHLHDLRRVEMCYAANAIAEFVLSNDMDRGIIYMLKSEFKGNSDIVEFARAVSPRIIPNFQDKFMRMDEDLVEWLNHTSDQRDYSKLISCSFLGMSVFQASTFMRLNPSSQYLLLKIIQEKTLEGRQVGTRSSSFDSREVRIVYGGLVCTLLRQLLVLNQVEMFNWVLSVLNLGSELGASPMLRLSILNFLSGMIPHSIWKMIDGVSGDQDKVVSFEEVVFEMNMMETFFEPYNLFLYIYLDHDWFLKGMKENKELIEFFSLPFDWNELEWMKDSYTVPQREYPF